MVLDYFFDKNLVFCLEADNQEQLFDQVATLLEEREIVTPTYREALITREKSFPTGLDMEFLGKNLPNVAIPHTDIVHNLAEKVVIVRLEKPITFHNMIAPDKEVEVSLLFFIINNSSSSQTNILAQLMERREKLMVLDYFFDKNLVFCLEADNQEHLFDQVATLLEEREIVTPTYREALITREKSFPTGLDMEFLGKDLPNVAIPHTDIVHNLAEKVVVVRLEKPITFHNMIAPDKEVEVSLLFFIINNSSSSQTNILAQLMDFFTGNGHLEDLSKISEPEALYTYIAEATA
ncbi:PTS system transporter subunit IIA [Streptococcus pneumoniae]|nr:PTS system transporter subunit IIA [Streptococcus pneumoniae]